MMMTGSGGMLTSLFLLSLALPGAQGLLEKSAKCSDSLGCIINPESTMMLTWRPTDRDIHFHLRGYVGSGNMYVAMGLSYDERMGDDDVVECVHREGVVEIFCSRNEGRNNIRYENTRLLDEAGTFEGGTMECSFRRSLNGYNVTGGWKHDLDLPWHIMLVWGYLKPGTDKKRHHTYVSVSSSKVSLRAVGSFETQKLSDTLIFIHGSLMMIAWVTLTSIGVIMARYYKGLLPETEVCNKQVWFQVHRGLMLLVLFLTVVGVIVIFVEVGGLCLNHSVEDMPSFLHPIIGIIVSSLAVLNPVLAVFRPDPKSPRRPIFNWIHRIVGTGSQILAVMAIFLGLKMEKSNAPVSMLLVLGAFVVWHFTMEVFLFCITFVKKKVSAENRRESSRSYAVQEKQEPVERPKPLKVGGFQEILLMLHSAVSLATIVFLLALLVSGH